MAASSSQTATFLSKQRAENGRYYNNLITHSSSTVVVVIWEKLIWPRNWRKLGVYFVIMEWGYRVINSEGGNTGLMISITRQLGLPLIKPQSAPSSDFHLQSFLPYLTLLSSLIQIQIHTKVVNLPRAERDYP